MPLQPESLEQGRQRVFGACGGKCGENLCIDWNDQQRPKFEHDCERCVFLGHFDENDLYFCGQDGVGPTVLARYDSDGPAYTSGLFQAGNNPHITEGTRRAIGRKLLTEEIVDFYTKGSYVIGT